MPLEIASFTTSSALLSLTATPLPSRIELCQDSSVGGLTPTLESYITIKSTAASLHVPVHIMIRPHARSFAYDAGDLEQMKESIERFNELGCEGFVLGCLVQHEEGFKVDRHACKALLDVIGKNRKVTFHRAFDQVSVIHMAEQLEVLVELGFDGLLTSGGAKSAVEGNDMLRMLVEKARGRIEIIVGGGVRSTNLKELRSAIGEDVKWWHSSAVTGSREEANIVEVEALGVIITSGDGEDDDELTKH